eukprot:gene10421-216_t
MSKLEARLVSIWYGRGVIPAQDEYLHRRRTMQHGGLNPPLFGSAGHTAIS